MEKMTYVKALEIALSTMADGEVKDKLTALQASLQKKASAERKPTAGQKANATVADAVYHEMEPDRLYLVSELMKIVPELEGFSNQKASAIVRTLKDAGRVERIEDKRKAYFRKVEA